MTIQEALEIRKQIIPYRYNVPSDLVQKSESVMKEYANKGELVYLDDTAKQIVWDALVQYQWSCHDTANSEHFAKDTFADIEKQVEELLMRFHEEWANVKH